MSWTWVRRDVLIAIHNEQLAEHGGALGMRDEGLFDSALARPEHLAAYQKPDVFQLAAAYAAGIIKNHPLVDGNKRVGFIAAVLFLELNGYRFAGSELEVVEKTLGVAANAIGEEEFALWLKANCERP